LVTSIWCMYVCWRYQQPGYVWEERCGGFFHSAENTLSDKSIMISPRGGEVMHVVMVYYFWSGSQKKQLSNIYFLHFKLNYLNSSCWTLSVFFTFWYIEKWSYSAIIRRSWIYICIYVYIYERQSAIMVFQLRYYQYSF